jgi:hypothetical protein
VDSRRHSITRVCAIVVVVLSLSLPIVMNLPVVTGTFDCNLIKNFTPSSILACGDNLNGFSKSYGWADLSTTYDPWFGVLNNGRASLLFTTSLLSIAFAGLVLRRRVRHRSVVTGAIIAGGTALAALIINVQHVSKFRRDWIHQSFCSPGLCSTTVDRGFGVTIAIVLVLIGLIIIATVNFERTEGFVDPLEYSVTQKRTMRLSETELETRSTETSTRANDATSSSERSRPPDR